MASCPSCGLEFATGERFCPNDGARLDAADLAATAPIGPDPLIGRVLDGRYRIDKKLGEGGMGAVYKAVHTGMDKVCAVKILRGAMSRDEIAAKRFQREAKSTSRLDHEHCVRVTDFGHTDDGLLFLAMEHLEGKTLGEELYQLGPLSPARAVNVARQVCLALAHAHDLGIIHRDLKPDNVFLLVKEGRNDFAKVLDFGLAKLLEREPEVGPDGRVGSISTLTEAGTVFGTPEYMSPEQAEGRPLDPRTDLYSLGVVMYQMVTGQLPFQAPSFIGILTKHLTETAIAPAERRPDLGIPLGLSALIMRSLEKDPGRRPPGARSLAAELERLDLTSPPLGSRIPKQIAQAQTINVQPLASSPEARTAQMPIDVQQVLQRDSERSQTVLPTEQVRDDLGASSSSAGRPPARQLLLWLGVPTLLLAIGLVAWFGRGSGKSSAAKQLKDPVDAGAAVTRPPDAAPASPDAAPPGPPDAGVAAVPTPRGSQVAEHLRQAAIWRKKGNNLKALNYLQQAVKADPGNATALYEFGAALLQTGQHEKGCATLKRALHDKRAKSLYEKEGCSLVTP